MDNSFSVDTSEISKAIAQLGGVENQLREKIKGALFKNAEALALKAKQLVPRDMGGLEASISAPLSTGELSFEISVNAEYAAFVEFGTGKYAAQYVSTLPADWQTYAAQFKGLKGGEGFEIFLERIYQWVKRNQIGYTYSVKTKRRDRVGKQTAETTDRATAYFIAIRILQKGIRPHPFLFPAYMSIKNQIVEDVAKAINSSIK